MNTKPLQLAYRPGNVANSHLPPLNYNTLNDINSLTAPVPLKFCHTEKTLLPPMSHNYRRHTHHHARHVGIFAKSNVPLETESKVCSSPTPSPGVTRASGGGGTRKVSGHGARRVSGGRSDGKRGVKNVGQEEGERGGQRARKNL